jgi:hypothetical protein
VVAARRRTRAALALSFLAGTAWAAPTGLNVIPTADLIPWHQLTLQIQNGNPDVNGDHPVYRAPQPVLQLQCGLPEHLEAGLDVLPANPPADDYRPALNVKWTPIAEGYRVPAIAVGAAQLGVGFDPTYYAVASRTLNFEQVQYQKFRAHHRNIKLRGIRAHLGIMKTVNAWRALVGTDVEISDRFVLYADWISGRSDSVSVGGVFVIDHDDSVQASLLRANDEDRLTGVLVAYTHTFSW